MAQANVTMALSGDEKLLVRALVKSEKEVDKLKGKLRDMGRTGSKAGAQTQKAFKGTGAGLGKAIAGFATIALAKRALTATSQALEQSSIRISQFQDEVTPFLSLGNNIAFGDELQKQILDVSTGFGLATGEIAKLFFAVQSNAASLSETIQKDLVRSALLLTKVTGTDSALALTALTKAMITYGDEVRDVTDLQNRLDIAAQRGATTFSDFALLLPDVLNAARAAGVGLNEVLAALIVGTQIGGKNEKTFTALRNILLKTFELEKEGVDVTGSLADVLERVNKLGGETKLRIFGTRNIALAQGLAENAGQVRDELERMDNLQFTNMNLAMAKLKTRLTDIKFLASEVRKISNQQGQNIGLQSPEFARASAKFGFRKIAATETLGPLLSSIPGAVLALTASNTIVDAIAGVFGISGTSEAGQELFQDFNRRAGQFQTAAATELQFRDGPRTAQEASDPGFMADLQFKQLSILTQILAKMGGGNGPVTNGAF